jgi:drug/metabolite transporter (DMT)-like permease
MPPSGSTYRKGAVFGIAAVSIWASWSVLTRLAVTTNMDAWDIAALRFGVAGLLLSPVSLPGLGAPYALVAAGGLSFAPAYDQAALNPGCMPLFVALIAAIALGDKLSTTRSWGSH